MARWLLVLFLVVSCAPQPAASVPEPQVIHPLFAPANGELPRPNDLGIRPLYALAEAELWDSFKGFSVTSTTRVRFSGALDPASLNAQTTLAFDITETTTPLPITQTYSGCDNSLTLASPTLLARGHTYLFALVRGIRGANGEDVTPSDDFASVLEAQHASLLPAAFDPKQKLEPVRQKLEPSFERLEAQGVRRRDLLVVWTLTTREDGEAWFDARAERLPFPNDLLRDPATGRVVLPPRAEDTPEERELKSGVGKLDGFSPTGPISVEFTLPLSSTTAVAGKSVRLFRRDTLEELTELSVQLSPDGLKLTVQPRLPLRPGTPYSLVLSNLRDTRGPVAAMPLATLLRLRNSVAENISLACGETAKQLEVERKALEPVLDYLELPGANRITRDQVNTVFSFSTQNIFKRIQELRAAPYQANLPLTVTDIVSKTPLEMGVILSGPCFQLPPSRVKTIVRGNLTTINFLDPLTRAFREDDSGTPEQIPFMMTVPEVTAGKPMPIAVFGHGLTSERRYLLFMAERLARQGIATVGIDFPYHGERSICLGNNHCANGGVCQPNGTCLLNGQRGPLARTLDFIPGIGGSPSSSGAAFIDLGNILATRDHFRQAFVDLSALTRLLSQMDWSPVIGTRLDTQQLRYVGISLGSILGTGAAAMDPSYSRMLLSVGGAGLIDLMRESNAFADTFRAALAVRGIVEGSPDYAERYATFANSASWVIAEVDPLNLGRYAVRELMPWEDPISGEKVTPSAKKLRLQMARIDTVIPNSATLRLRTATGVNPDIDFTTYVAGSHIMLSDPIEPEFCPTQSEMGDFLAPGQN
ncbi:MAG: Ig-like domain-containing protein [Myxococcaceae bacterium]